LFEVKQRWIEEALMETPRWSLDETNCPEYNYGGL